MVRNEWFATNALSLPEQEICSSSREAKFLVEGNQAVWTVEFKATHPSQALMAGNGKYTIVRSSEDSGLSKYPYEVSKLGTTSAFLDCQTTNRPTEPLQIVCGGLGNAFTFKESSKQFQEYYGIGYVDGVDASASTLSVTTGQCTQID
jgi:hypothetical protein